LPFRGPDLSLRDIATAIGDIRQFTAGMDAAAFRHDPKTVAAVERKLQVISEAAIRLGNEAETLCPGLPWRDIEGSATGSDINTTMWTWTPSGKR
jgi:uncharacterized protein with HEPN domain